ncbi:MAG: hypothetical protein NTY53_04130 [Kiritimatiellaeota bacterium]|nr:hypothetical protein [Kiritimatiellota bacterium]
MSNKINVLPIICDHFKTLKDAAGTQFLRSDIAVFFVIPLGLAAITVVFSVITGHIPSEKVYETATLCISVIIPLMLGVLFSMYSIVQRLSSTQDHPIPAAQKAKNQEAIQLLQQLHYNIMYIVLVSGFSLLFLGLGLINCIPKALRLINEFAVVFIGGNLAFTLMMVIKRISRLVQYDLSKP